IGGIGVVGWGVGGIEAEAVMLGQPIYMLIPEVVGMKLTGSLPEGCTATDLVLRVTEVLREHGVVGTFVEYFGPGLASMTVANRATLANMAPEYGATMGFFPVDQQTLDYMHLSGRDGKLIQTVEQYCKAQGLWREQGHQPEYIETLELDLSTIEPALAGPKRPQDRISLSGMKGQWEQDLSLTFGKDTSDATSTLNSWTGEGGQPVGAEGGNEPGAGVKNRPEEQQSAVAEADPGLEGVDVSFEGEQFKLRHGAVVIAAITSCTNTSNPSVMLGAGLVAKKAHEKGLTRKPWVKTSFAPGSKVVTEYLNKAGLTPELEALGFHLVGYGCTTCIGNSGPLPEPISRAIREGDLVAASVLSGNRNFEGRINPDVKANYLASPPLVVAYALAGTVDIDLTREPLGTGRDGEPVYLKDIWPSQTEVAEAEQQAISRAQFLEQYAHVFEGSQEWQAVETTGGSLYEWEPESTYVQEPPFFVGLSPDAQPISPISGARCLGKFGDSVTTDHISPAGAIKKESPAGQYLIEHGVPVSMFNSYGSRRGNHEVMMRGTFANVRVRNQLAPGTEGGWTTYFGPAAGREYTPGHPAGTLETETLEPGKTTSIYNAAMHYQQAGVPLVVLAGKDYGMGSSRDWAAKGTYLLGVRAVLAESYERIHRSNLVGMGVLPLQLPKGESAKSLGLDGTETFDIAVGDDVKPRQTIQVKATKADGKTVEFDAQCRLDTPVEVEYYRNGGILHTVLRRMAKGE
ncbi:MAG: aconitate hydratase, partial [Phycisphaeraceae bacterium]